MNGVRYKAYHGTSYKNYNEIKDDGFKASKSGWLGKGVYFFQEDKSLAQRWARIRHKKERVHVIECELEIEEKKILDIVDPLGSQAKKVDEFKREFINQVEKRKGRLEEKDVDTFEGKIIDLICSKERYQLVRAGTYTASEQERRYSIIGHISNGVELCVKDLKYIKGVK